MGRDPALLALPLRLAGSAMTWRTFWRFTLAVALGTAIADLSAKALWFFVVLERLP